MDVRAGMRDAKKRAYAADEQARAARASARAAEEQAQAAEKQARAALPRTLHGVEVVPPEADATTYFVGVYWDISGRFWRAAYKCGKKTIYVPGTYPTNQRAARARYDCIRAEDLERFNDMDARDDATDLMVPREKKPPKKRPREPVAAAPTRQSSRVRKAVSKD